MTPDWSHTQFAMLVMCYWSRRTQTTNAYSSPQAFCIIRRRKTSLDIYLFYRPVYNAYFPFFKLNLTPRVQKNRKLPPHWRQPTERGQGIMRRIRHPRQQMHYPWKWFSARQSATVVGWVHYRETAWQIRQTVEHRFNYHLRPTRHLRPYKPSLRQ